MQTWMLNSRETKYPKNYAYIDRMPWKGEDMERRMHEDEVVQERKKEVEGVGKKEWSG